MLQILLGIFIGIIIGAIGIISIRKYKAKKYFENEDILEPLIDLLINNNIIKNWTKYIEDVENKYVYVLMENELKQYGYENNNENKYLEINSINVSEELLNILENYIMWNYSYGLNSMYSRIYKFINSPYAKPIKKAKNLP
jgi:hypothetical protein